MRIGRLIFGVMLGVISMWFSHDLYASEHRVETMREFEQAWHLDEPDQTIRLEADIVDDIATGLARANPVAMSSTISASNRIV